MKNFIYLAKSFLFVVMALGLVHSSVWANSGFTLEAGDLVVKEGKVGIGGTPVNTESLYVNQKADGLNLRLHKGDGGNMSQLTDGANFDFLFGIDSVSDYGFFGTNNNDNIESPGEFRTLVLKDGRIGIGTTGPNSMLHLYDGGTDTKLIVQSQVSPNATASVDLLGRDASNVNLTHTLTSSAHDLVYKQDSTERLRIDASGNVGIGTTDPKGGLHISAGSATMVLDDPVYQDNNDMKWKFDQYSTDGSLHIHRFDNVDIYGTYYGRFVIDQNGNVGIGTTSPSYKLHVNGTAYATGAAGSLSDIRHKKGIYNLPSNALETIQKLRPVTFKWKEPKDSGMQGRQFGFIAQEVEEILPEAVLTQDNNEQTKGIKYDTLIPVLTKAIQILTEKNKELTARIQAMETTLQEQLQ